MNCKSLTSEEVDVLFAKLAAGDASARDAIILGCQGLVVEMARKKYLKIGGIAAKTTLEDMVQDGNLGLIEAVEKFNPTMGNKFSTYATYWINIKIDKGLEESTRAIKLPDHKVKEVSFISRSKTALEHILNRDVSVADIYQHLNHKFTPEDIRDLLELYTNSIMVSLEAPAGEDGEGSLEDIVNGAADDGNIDRMLQRETLRELRAAVANLDERERLVIIYSFGLNNTQIETLDKIADILYNHGYTNRDGQKLSREYVRQIKEHALGQLSAKMA